MNTRTNLQPPDTASFASMRAWVNTRLAAKGLPAAPVTAEVDNALEGAGATPEDIEKLKVDIATLITLEGRRSFWSGVAVNALFFGLGLLAGHG